MLQTYRRQTLDAAQNEYNEHVQRSIVANINLTEIRKEVDNDEVGDNDVDVIPMDESEEEVGEFGSESVRDGSVGPESVSDGPVGPEKRAMGHQKMDQQLQQL